VVSPWRAVASRVVHAELDAPSEKALEALLADGGDEAEAVHAALVAAARQRRDAALRQEVRRIASDPRDREEMRQIAADMEELAPPLPPP